MHIRVQALEQRRVSVSLGYIRGVDLRGRTAALLPKALAAVYIPASSVLGLLLLHTLPSNLIICDVFDNSCSGRYKAISHCGFALHLCDDCRC